MLEYLKFLWTAARHPVDVCDVMPIWEDEATMVAERATSFGEGAILEVGPGTGRILRELLLTTHSGPFVFVEKQPEFVEGLHELLAKLRQEYPNLPSREVTIIQGDAEQLTTCAQKYQGHTRCIIESLPLPSWPEEKSRAVVQQMHSMLDSEGVLLAYAFRRPEKLQEILSSSFATVSEPRRLGRYYLLEARKNGIEKPKAEQRVEAVAIP